jgi:hypothetical protein
VSAELSALQTRAVALLEAAAYFADVAVLPVSDGTLEARLAQSLSGRGLAIADGVRAVKPGLALIVGVHAADLVSDGVKLRLDPLVRVAVLENPLTNRATGGAGLLALDAAVEVARRLHRQPALAGVADAVATTRFVAAAPCLELLGEELKRNLYGVQGGLGWHVNFTIAGGLSL